MKLYIREKVFSWKDGFDILDSDGDRVYKCRGEETPFGHKFEILGKRDKMAEIHEKMIKLRPKYTVEIGKKEFEVIKKAIGIGDNFIVKGLDWEISGDVIHHKYEIKHGRETIAKIRKKMLRAMDTYELDVAEDKNNLETVCCAVIVDAIVFGDKK